MYKRLIVLLLLTGCSAPVDNKKIPDHPVAPDSVQKDSVAITTNMQQQQIKVDDTLDAIAAIISGMGANSEIFSTVVSSSSYKSFSSSFSERWKKFDTTRLAKLSEFSSNELSAEITPEKKLFYPFSGPDILYAHTFFPKPDTFILFGLEPVGTLPDFQSAHADSVQRYFNKINTSLNAILNFSFFRTESMSKDLKNTEVNGTIHLLFLFLKRTGNSIVSAKPLTIDSTGKKVYYASFEALRKAPLKTKGVEIRFKTKDNQLKELNYYSLNATDEALKNNRGFVAYLNSNKGFNTYLKGASYLLHRGYFSTVRNVILNGSSTVIQDDSGIALRYFLQSNQWDFKLYGSYTKPISLFKQDYQENLDSLYKNKGSENLGFGIGYNFKDKNSNLMIAKKR